MHWIPRNAGTAGGVNGQARLWKWLWGRQSAPPGEHEHGGTVDQI